MDKRELEKERRKQQRLERLGIEHPVCVNCGEDDERCFEHHHIAGRAYDDSVAIVCCNCHKKLSDDQLDHPSKHKESPTQLECIGRFLLGVADLFLLLAEKLKQFGQQLIEMAQVIVAPSGENPS